jgi:hypothetical protein
MQANVNRARARPATWPQAIGFLFDRSGDSSESFTETTSRMRAAGGLLMVLRCNSDEATLLASKTNKRCPNYTPQRISYDNTLGPFRPRSESRIGGVHIPFAGSAKKASTSVMVWVMR